MKSAQANVLREHLALAVAASTLHEAEVTATARAINELLSGKLVTLEWQLEIESALESLWTRNVSFSQFLEEEAESRRKAHDEVFSCSLDLMRPRWIFILSDDFTRCIAKIDRNLQGRVLEALARITHSPTTAVGDMIKPLSGDLKGLWRYRIGDYRLIYYPNITDHKITLLTFEPRSDVYQKTNLQIERVAPQAGIRPLVPRPSPCTLELTE